MFFVENHSSLLGILLVYADFDLWFMKWNNLTDQKRKKKKETSSWGKVGT